MPCCIILYYVVLCCIVPYDTLYCAVSYITVHCITLHSPHYIAVFYITLHYTMLHHAMSCYVNLCCILRFYYSLVCSIFWLHDILSSPMIPENELSCLARCPRFGRSLHAATLKMPQTISLAALSPSRKSNNPQPYTSKPTPEQAGPYLA